MNHLPVPPVDEAEWEAQERAIRTAFGHHAEALDVAAARYRPVARALATHPHGMPPADFAATVAALAVRRERGIELRLSKWLSAAFMLAMVAGTAIYGASAWQALSQPSGEAGRSWLLMVTSCMALSWLCRGLLARAPETGPVRAGK